jgi:hypothetical protein
MVGFAVGEADRTGASVDAAVGQFLHVLSHALFSTSFSQKLAMLSMNLTQLPGWSKQLGSAAIVPATHCRSASTFVRTSMLGCSDNLEGKFAYGWIGHLLDFSCTRHGAKGLTSMRL